MAWAEELPSGKWRACWRDDQGVKRASTGPQKRGYRDKEAALSVARQKEARARAGLDAGTGRSLTWAQWRPEWERVRVVEPSTARQDRYRLDAYLAPRWGKVRLNKIKRADVQQWVNELGRTKSARGAPLSAATVQRVYHLLSASLRTAVHDGRLQSSPCVGIKLPTPSPGKERFLSRAEVDAVIHHVHDEDHPTDTLLYRCVIVLLSETGLRFGELAGLHWHRVDLEQGVIDVVETWDSVARRVKAYPKGRKRRAVPVSERALAALSELHSRRRLDAKACGLPHADVTRCRSPLVCMTVRGVPLDAHNMGRRQWANACERAQVSGATLHDLRHTYASWLCQAGVSIQTLSELLGHSSVVVSQRYSHLGSSQHSAVLAALNT